MSSASSAWPPAACCLPTPRWWRIRARPEGLTQILLPVSEIAVEVGSVRSVNMVMLGAVIAKTKLLKRETIMAVLEETMGRKKPELLEFNIKAFNAGYEAAGKGE